MSDARISDNELKQWAEGSVVGHVGIMAQIMARELIELRRENKVLREYAKLVDTGNDRITVLSPKEPT